MSLTKVSYSMITGDIVNVFDFMTTAMITDVQARTGTIDTAAAIQAAIDSLGTTGGVVRLPKGKYLTNAQISLKQGVSLIGDGQIGGPSATDEGITTIYAAHTGAAALSLKGVFGCRVSDLCLQGDQTTQPKVGLLLGRSSAASCGYHKILRVSVYGYFSVASVYSIASEDNLWEDLNIWMYAGAGKYCFYTSTKDVLGVDSLTESSNLDNTVIRPFFVNSSTDATSACIYYELAQAMGSWTFMGGYLTPYAGSYVQMNSGVVDSLAALGPFLFVGVSGEILSGGDPTYGFNLSTSVAGQIALPGLTITNPRLVFVAGATRYQFYQDPKIYLIQPNIVMQPQEAFPYATISIVRKQIFGGIFSVGRYAFWEDAVFSSGWANTYGYPAYAKASYMIDATNTLSCRGTVTGGTGIIFILPVEYWPTYSMFFPFNGGILGVNTAGHVYLASGSATAVDLTTIRFNYMEN